ncbi:MAG: preprotein translocase subunit YajC [Candidatus Brocadiia bacterium]|nr:MAG: preprotein translocase subunit YajC [Candidatus Brocadiia bacterium]
MRRRYRKLVRRSCRRCYFNGQYLTFVIQYCDRSVKAEHFYFILFRGPQKKQQQIKKMVQALQKNDRILTVGGIYGTIVEIKDNEITIKIDESNNTKMRISRNAIADNLSKGKEQQ